MAFKQSLNTFKPIETPYEERSVISCGDRDIVGVYFDLRDRAIVTNEVITLNSSLLPETEALVHAATDYTPISQVSDAGNPVGMSVAL